MTYSYIPVSYTHLDVCKRQDYYTDHGVDVYPQSAAGVPFTAAYIAAKGDPIATLQAVSYTHLLQISLKSL